MNVENICLICYQITNHKLECSHFICKECLVQLIEEKLKTLQLTSTDYSCPKCQVQFNIDVFVNTSIFNELIEYSLKNNCIQGLNENEMMIDCGNSKCNYKFIINKNAKYSKCPICQQIYCLKCNKPYESKCCLQTITGKCPRCKIQVYKEEGCNFLCCKSQYCKGKVYFCAICFVILPIEDHYTHYIDNNPYNNCKIGKLKPNKYKCPGCLTLNPLKCQIIEELNQCYCRSLLCKDSIYCLSCNQKIQKNEKHDCRQNQCIIM